MGVTTVTQNVSLRRISKKSGRALFNKLWPESDYPPMGTNYYEALQGPVVVGWVATQYKCRRPLQKAHVVIHGLYVMPEARGQNLQVPMRTLAVQACRPKGAKTKILVRTYCSACNIASMRNILATGALPYASFVSAGTTFIKFEGYIEC